MSSLLRTATCLATGVALFAAPAAGAAPWATPVTVDDASPAAFQATTPQLASDAAGNLTAAWIGGGAPTRAVYAASRPRGGSWSTPKQVSGSAQFGITDLTLSVNDEGAAIVGWSERRTYRTVIVRSSTRPTSSASWGAPVDVQPAAPAGSAVPSTDAYALDLVPGGAVTVWHRQFIAENGGSVVGEESRGGYLPFAGAAPWQAEAAPTVRRPKLGVDGNGTATLVDVSADGAVTAATRPVGGAWSAPATIAAADGGPAATADLAVNARGEAVVSWVRDSGDVSEVRVARRSAAGTWTTASTLAVAAGDGLFDAEVGIDPAGRATVTWARFAASASEYTSALETSSAPADGGFTAATTLTTWQRPAGDGTVIPGLQFSDLSVNGAGQALLTWIKGNAVQAVTRDKDGWSSAETIATTSTEWTRSFDGDLGADQAATVLVGNGAAVTSTSKPLGTPVVPSGRALAVNGSLVSWNGRCPLTVSAYGNGRTAKIPAGLRGSTKTRCIVGGTIPQPASAKVGSTALVVLSGGNVLPAVVTAKVIAVD